MPAVNRVAQEFTDRLAKIRYPLNDEVSDLTTEIGRWSLENAGSRVFDKRLGTFEIGSEAEEFARQMVEANRTIFKYSGILKLSFPFYKVSSHCPLLFCSWTRHFGIVFLHFGLLFESNT